ncbi:MAG: GntR family transcriptional regulator [SAR324 cluster bacterium]|jgi:GntR family transcriptional repressor for pyruvate dehydrogenase complex|nr:GntR family transcriptional regulator [SAR324 cluster bacterium]MDP7501249.1 GntR family transcriptional regulator [SAR324 cluster bacterium]|tara:strand:+ start:42 stop:740 length:699 start_codon:yes stop_codon:yes gene_type:complete
MEKNPIEVISQGIIEDIKNNTLPSGKPIPPERKLSERFGHSRTSVRAALYHLEKLGYLELKANRRPTVLQPNINSIVSSTIKQLINLEDDFETTAHLEQLRHFIEIGALSSVITKSGNVEYIKIHNALLNNFESIGSFEKFIESDIIFHRSIVAIVGNPILISLHKELLVSTFTNRKKYDNQNKRDTMVYNEHREIYQSILDGNLEHSTKVLDKHLTRSFLDLLSTQLKNSN